MKRRFLHTLLTAACVAGPLAVTTVETAHAQSVMRPGRDLVLSVGRGQLVNVGGSMTNVFVADDKIADVEVKSASQLYVFGKGGGETTVYASNGAGDVIWSANVRVGNNIESVDQMLRLAMPDAKVSVATMGSNTFLLTGTVASPEDAAEAQRLVAAFVGGSASVGKAGGGMAAGAAAVPNVISRLKTATPLQINLQVRFAEVSRTLVREINTNITTRDLTGGFTMGLSRGRTPGTIGDLNTSNLPQLDASSIYGLPSGSLKLPFDPTTGRFITGGTQYSFNPSVTGATAIGIASKLFGMDMLGALDMGEKSGLVTILAQPNLTALSGETADFLAGGEYPIPVSQSLGSVSIEYKKYGVSLAYTPTVLANGRISIRVRPEVSELSTQGSVVLNGFQVPALTIRRAETTVELGSGQSFMIAGLLSNSSQNLIDKTPGAGDVPVLGALFRSTNFRRGETELVIVVTPYLVNPVDAKDIKLPTDGYKNPSLLQNQFGLMESGGKSGEQRPSPSQGQDRAPDAGMSMLAPSAQTKPEKTRKDRRSASSNAPAPGFNLN